MTGNARREVDTLRERIQSGERGGAAVDRDVLIDFSDRLDLLREEYGSLRHIKLLRHCTRMAENTPDGTLADALNERSAAETIVRWIHREYDHQNGASPETNRDYRVALRIFGKRTSDENGDSLPDSLDWVSQSYPRDYSPAPDPADMLSWEDDIVPMVESCRNPRDSALIAVQFDAGMRGHSELYEATVGDITDGKYGMQIRVDGKTGQRSINLIPSIPHLQRWLSEHPAPDDSDAPLWSKLDRPERSSYTTFLNYFKRAAERADVEKPVTPTNFRKSNASWLARRGANAALIEDRQGRTRGSDAVARYVARFGDEAETEYARLHGLDVSEDESEEVGPITCPRCDRETPREKSRCIWCSQALTTDAIEEAQRTQQSALRAMGELAEQENIGQDEAVDVLDALIDQRVQARLDQVESG